MGVPSVTGRCRLCLARDVPLHDSHIMPKWTYKRARNPDAKNPHPYAVTRFGAYQTSEQVREHMLCTKCEARFNGPEAAASQLAYFWNKPSRLVQMVRANAVWFPGETGRPVVGAFLNDPRVRQMGYYALSIAWRASVSKTILDPIRLGGRRDEIRRYLVGTHGLPHAVAVSMYVLAEDEPLDMRLTTSEPFTDRTIGCRRHRFSTAGLMFEVYEGPGIPEACRLTCTARSQAPFVAIVNQGDTSQARQMKALRAASIEAQAKRGKPIL